ncbi:streptomycin 6-kinase [Mesorhizobium albiziae]|uniref:Streptomycin 6-kinase n=1 Tax=Neomesorhizobium albiziae TaxID=335020 RepID=A0A1I3YMN4_9HYPH|nr:aminoglycoside phosphotransferase family protein [Mesorhizobium albiziae]GLS33397.1 aminoglycoside/hydroxyurea antibiotic resistance kinase [Mesorhizobium albiziae]SFK33197.1 streptomycin 6-kinase [Mesorhizobium albiziae]
MDLPSLPDRWNVSDPILIAETFSSRIWKVRREDGSLAVIKALKPFDDVADELRGAHYLSWRDGVGAVRLLGFERQSMLLEYAGDRLLVDELNENGDRRATEIAAEVMAMLFSPSDVPPPADLQPLRERFASLFKKAGADRDAGLESPYREAAEIAERLLSNPVELRVLHGDLHHDNILHGERGWLAIDPKGILGDPGFDAANFLFNPLDRHDLTRDPERIAHMAETFATVLGQSPAAILDHAIAWGCLSASWHAEDRNEVEETSELAVAAAVRAVRANF